MSTPYAAFGRTDQKGRTRAALVRAARDLVARGVSPTVEQAAAAAAVSRTTAYRYFPSQRALLAAAHPETDTASMLGEAPPEDPAARLDRVVAAVTDMIVETEPQQRTMLRLSLDAEPDTGVGALPLRQGRATAWITEALEELRVQLGDAELDRLVLAIRSAIGIEALVWLTDVGGLSRTEAVELMRWSARSLLQAALTTGPPSATAAPAASAVETAGPEESAE
ncbi:TetR/AcrR family transcriptional regulator [Nocardioides mesophilus]|uniref:TetR/AcrR family transcriptional regulator n=1 Tax=Nocardioides mesophilus TaxID=433659 RepID=A0A7G9RFG3_9ACTN|nr:TetR/AcrR family transcriptional regulator [Nocardioides mesophilus]QNN54338.1 TetR/AcrR family transcriptional regulator [Nocardioides mesophilus]